MVEKEELFKSRVKYNGVFSFNDFYNFCYSWFADEEGYLLIEEKYVEKMSGDSKLVEIEWVASKKITDYFKFQIKVKFRITGMTKVDITDSKGNKIATNKGAVDMAVKGLLLRDYEGKFESTATRKFIRGVYEKWVITARVDEMQTKLIKTCDDYITQAKAFLDLEGKK